MKLPPQGQVLETSCFRMVDDGHHCQSTWPWTAEFGKLTLGLPCCPLNSFHENVNSLRRKKPSEKIPWKKESVWKTQFHSFLAAKCNQEARHRKGNWNLSPPKAGGKSRWGRWQICEFCWFRTKSVTTHNWNVISADILLGLRPYSQLQCKSFSALICASKRRVGSIPQSIHILPYSGNVFPACCVGETSPISSWRQGTTCIYFLRGLKQQATDKQTNHDRCSSFLFPLHLMTYRWLQYLHDCDIIVHSSTNQRIAPAHMWSTIV